MANVTYRDLEKFIANMSDEQKNCDVTIFVSGVCGSSPSGDAGFKSRTLHLRFPLTRFIRMTPSLPPLRGDQSGSLLSVRVQSETCQRMKPMFWILGILIW